MESIQNEEEKTIVFENLTHFETTDLQLADPSPFPTTENNMDLHQQEVLLDSLYTLPRESPYPFATTRRRRSVSEPPVGSSGGMSPLQQHPHAGFSPSEGVGAQENTVTFTRSGHFLGPPAATPRTKPKHLQRKVHPYQRASPKEKFHPPRHPHSPATNSLGIERNGFVGGEFMRDTVGGEFFPSPASSSFSAFGGAPRSVPPASLPAALPGPPGPPSVGMVVIGVEELRVLVKEAVREGVREGLKGD
ncbi:hypothetical protein K470DRAFT_87267 [Piedraia hortae CBS 480.64]|uniref:Uncharacterized protein n=1 Tax=Piedraia hortae CBS 480.64 TaxID=1314780 RepID=A0A6A7BZA8_9PEZI|nr:hypothetical protein K470DRAFT_87267 [Piedraia hortae CBS 480.64]